MLLFFVPFFRKKGAASGGPNGQIRPAGPVVGREAAGFGWFGEGVLRELLAQGSGFTFDLCARGRMRVAT